MPHCQSHKKKTRGLHKTSEKAALSASNINFTIGFHFRPSLGVELKSLLSFSKSTTGIFQALSAAGMRANSWTMDTIVSSTSNGLYGSRISLGSLRYTVSSLLSLAFKTRAHYIIDDITASGDHFVIVHQAFTQSW